MAKKAPAAAQSSGVKVRVLVSTSIEGVAVDVDAVLDLPEPVAKLYEGTGAVDSHPDAVAYAESLKA